MKSNLTKTILSFALCFRRSFLGRDLRFASTLAFCLISIVFLKAQIITTTQPESFHLCHEAAFSISIYNNKEVSLTENRLELTLPCGLAYAEGSLTGGQEEDIDILDQPVFTFPDLPLDSTQTITFRIKAPCSVLDCIDNGTIFFNELKYTHSDGEVESNTDPYHIETAQLIITKIEDPVLDGFKGAELTRKIYIRNTRLGALDSFVYKNNFDEGILVTSENGEDISVNQNELLLRLSGQDFTSIGDGDEFFEFNEEIIIEENILVETCAYDLLTAVSNIEVSWGCGGEICATTKQNGVVDIGVDYDFGHILSFTPTLNEPTCYCDGIPVEQSLTIKNNGTYTECTDIFVQISQGEAFSRLPDEKIKVVIDGDTSELVTHFSNASNQACYPGGKYYGTVNTTIPRLYPGQTAKLVWGNSFCSLDSCFAEANEWSYTWHYYKDCAWPEDAYHSSGQASVVRENDYLIRSELVEIEALKGAGDPQEFIYIIESPLLKNNSGELKIKLDLPCGFKYLDNTFDIDGKAANYVKLDTLGKRRLLTLKYNLPLPSSSGALRFPAYFINDNECFEFTYPPKDSLITSCPWDSICQRPPPKDADPSTFRVFANASININEHCDQLCNFRSCYNLRYNVEYPTSGVRFDTIPGYLEFDHNVKRISYGLPDNDENNIPDSTGTLDYSKIRLDRATIGDSLKAEIIGVVISDISDSEFENLVLELKFKLKSFDLIRPQYLKREIENFFDPLNGLINYYNMVKLIISKDKKEFTIENLPFYSQPIVNIIDSSVIYRYNLHVNELISRDKELPIDYKFTNADSIKFESFFDIKYKIYTSLWGGSSRPESFLIETTAKSVLKNDSKLNFKNEFSCKCRTSEIDVSNYHCAVSYSGTTFSSCDSTWTLTVDGHFGAYNNFFPFEARRMMIFEKVKIPRLEGYELLTPITKYIKADGLSMVIDTPIMKVYPSPYDEGAVWAPDQLGYYTSELENLQSVVLGDYNDFRHEYTYKMKKCSYPRIHSNPYNYRASYYHLYLNSMTGNGHRKWYYYKYNTPRLDISICNNIYYSSKINWDVKYENISQYSSFIYNPWLKIINEGDRIIDFKVLNVDNSNEILALDNVFYFNEKIRNGSSIPLQISALNTSCTEEEVIFRYGWNCEPYTDPLETPCEEFEVVCTAYSPPGIIDMLPNTEESVAELCDTMPWTEIQVFDAGLGSVYELELTAQLPKGLYLSPGTSQIAWPAEDGQYISVGNPLDLGGGEYKWFLTEFADTLKQHGLPGVNSVPDNTMSLRFKTFTDCDFTSGTRIIHRINALKICGEPTNSVAKVSRKMHIEGAEAPHEALISSTVSDDNLCAEQKGITVQVVYDKAHDEDTELQIQLPGGVQIDPQSITCDLPECNPLIEENYVSWTVPAGTPALEINFQLKGLGTKGCQSLILPILTTATINATCISNNEKCPIDIVTGEKHVVLNLERPIYAFSSLEVFPQAGNTDISDMTFTLENHGAENDEAITITLAKDLDDDGEITPADELIGTFEYDVVIEKDSSMHLRIDALDIPAEDLCNLIAGVMDEDNCICSEAFRVAAQPLYFPDAAHYEICSGESISIGRAESSGSRYRWQNTEYLDCDTCSTATFQFTNDDFEDKTFIYQLKQLTEAGCELTYEYLVTVHADPRIWQADEEICEGNSAVLMAAEGSEYHWSGEGISIPSEQIQVVQPLEPTWYYVTITDNYDCVGYDSVYVMVHKNPIANAGPDLVECYGGTPQLQAQLGEGYHYLWSPGYPFLDDPTIPNPKVLTDEPQNFTLKVTNANCSAEDEVFVSYEDGLDITVSRDTAICLGDTIEMYATGANQYFWSPLYTNMCQNDSCSLASYAPKETTDFRIIGETTEGCLDTANIHIEIIEDEILTNDEALTICSGTSVILYGEEQDTPGTYCDTLTFDSGCMYISCTELIVEDTLRAYDKVEICAGTSYEAHEAVFDQPGVYCKAYKTEIGCDSIHCLELVVLDTIRTFESGEICADEVYEAQGQNYDQSGTYCVTYQTEMGCDSVHCLDLVVHDLPEFELDPIEAEIQKGLSVQLSGTSGFESYNWTPSDGLNCSDCSDPVASPLETTTYTLEVENEFGCRSSKEITVTVLDACGVGEILIPNAFSPNGDGKNDRFRIANLHEGIPGVRMMIFNRWGEKLYEANDNEGWDGRYLDREMAADTYIYVMVVDCGYEERVFKGNVLLVR